MRYEYIYSKAKRTTCGEAALPLRKVYRITDYFPIHSVDLRSPFQRKGVDSALIIIMFIFYEQF